MGKPTACRLAIQGFQAGFEVSQELHFLQILSLIALRVVVMLVPQEMSRTSLQVKDLANAEDLEVEKMLERRGEEALTWCLDSASGSNSEVS